MKKKITRRRFLSNAFMLLFSAAAATGAGRLIGRSRTEKSEITKTSRKKADYYRELAG